MDTDNVEQWKRRSRENMETMRVYSIYLIQYILLKFKLEIKTLLNGNRIKVAEHSFQVPMPN